MIRFTNGGVIDGLSGGRSMDCFKHCVSIETIFLRT